MLTTTVQLLGAANNDSQMVMHITMINTDILLARESQLFSDPTRAHGSIDHGKFRKRASKHK